MDKPTVTYAPRPDATPTAETAALASIYRFVIEASRKKKATRPGGPDDAIVRNTEEVSHVDQRPD